LLFFAAVWIAPGRAAHVLVIRDDIVEGARATALITACVAPRRKSSR